MSSFLCETWLKSLQEARAALKQPESSMSYGACQISLSIRTSLIIHSQLFSAAADAHKLQRQLLSRGALALSSDKFQCNAYFGNLTLPRHACGALLGRLGWVSERPSPSTLRKDPHEDPPLNSLDRACWAEKRHRQAETICRCDHSQDEPDCYIPTTGMPKKCIKKAVSSPLYCCNCQLQACTARSLPELHQWQAPLVRVQ